MNPSVVGRTKKDWVTLECQTKQHSKATRPFRERFIIVFFVVIVIDDDESSKEIDR